MVHELSHNMYRNFASKITNWEAWIQTIANTRWDIKDLGFECSPYIDQIIRELEQFTKKMNSETKVANIPKKTAELVWSEIIKFLMEQLVEGFSRAKKCTNEGRTQMSLDHKILSSGIERLTTLRPIPYGDYVLDYVKAFYYSEIDFIQWCRDHPVYTLKQYLNILNVGIGTQIKKQNLKQLTTTIEEIYTKQVKKG